jgi:hypothetical protein
MLEELVHADCVAMRCSDLGSQVAAVEVGLGIAPLPCFVADRRPSLIRLFPPEEQLRRPLWLLWHRELRQTARVRALVDHLAQALHEERPMFEGTAALANSPELQNGPVFDAASMFDDAKCNPREAQPAYAAPQR